MDVTDLVRVPKILGSDVELGNFIDGDTAGDPNAREFSSCGSAKRLEDVHVV